MGPDERDKLIDASDEVLLRYCQMDFTRSSGPGGQHRNKVESGVRIRHQATGVTAAATERRSQHQNRVVALVRMRRALALHVRGPAVERAGLAKDLVAVLDSRNWPKLSTKTPGYWRLAARILDRLAADGARLSDSAKALDISTASLSKFLTTDDGLWQTVLQMRSAAGLPPLRQ